MKLDKEEERQRIFDAMLKANGDRSVAAQALGVSLRTFYRYMGKHDMDTVFEKMGWNKQPGPVKGETNHGGTVIQKLVVQAIREKGGSMKSDIGALTKAIYGGDEPRLRGPVMNALAKLTGVAKVVDWDEDKGVWSLT